MDDLGSEEGAGGKAKSRGGASSGPFWKSQGFAAVLAIVAVLVLVGGVYVSFFNSGSPKPPESMTLIDFNTGELFSAKLGSRSYVIPMKNPNSGERTLLPVVQEDNGDWVVTSRFRELLPEQSPNNNAVRNASSGVVEPIDDTVTKLK